MPMTILERDEFTSTETGDWLGAFSALFGKQLAVTICTIGLFVLRCEFESGQLFGTIGAGETLLVPRVAFVSHTTTTNDFRTLGTSLSVLGFVTGYANHLVFTWDETFGTDWLFAFHTKEALLVPLLTTVFVFTHSGFEHTLTAVTTSGKSFVITVGAVQLLFLGRERAISQGGRTRRTFEAFFMPVAFFE